MGKASKMRDCPALGRGISSADCGEQRNSKLACPADCIHNPFNPAHYDQLLEIEDRLDAKTMDRLAKSTTDPLAESKAVSQAQREGFVAVQSYFVWKLFFATDANNQTFARRWELAGFPDLKNDERVFMRGKMQMHVALLEFHRVLADGRLEAVDLLAADPAPIIVLDRRTAARAARFTNLLTWSYPLPHFSRTNGAGVLLPDVPDFTAPELVREIVGHLGGPVTEPEIRRWLAQHFNQFSKSVTAVSLTRHQQSLAGMDAKWGVATYELRAKFAECRDWLDQVADVDFDELTEAEMNEGFAEAREWFYDPPHGKLLAVGGGEVVLGRILLGQSVWRVEAMGAEKLSRLRSLFESHLAGRVRFTSERIDDLGGRMAAREPAAESALIPPRLLANPPQMIMATSRIPAPPREIPPEGVEQWIRESVDRAFLDEKLPALDNRTPREAARDPALRPKLLQLMKVRVRIHDEHNLETGGKADINWLLRELDLPELIFDPPPWRPPPPQDPNAPPDPDWDPPEFFEDPVVFGDPVAVDPARPPAPLLPAEPLSPEEATERLKAGIAQFPTALAAQAELLASGSTLLVDIDDLTFDSLSEQDYACAISFVLQAWFALVPRGFRAPEIDYDDLETAFRANLQIIVAAVESTTPRKMEQAFLDSAQPGLTMTVISGFLEFAMKSDKDLRPDLAAQPVILALLKTVVDELDAALRPE